MYRFFLFLFSICAFQAEALPAQVFIIRNAETSDEGDALSTKGKERAAAFVPYFMETSSLFEKTPPAAIYAMPPASGQSLHPTADTVTPLAEKLKLTVTTSYVASDYKKMVDAIKSDASLNSKVVMICWDRDAIPEITRAFGALQSASRWNNTTFDRVWIISFSPTGRASLRDLPQRLLFGDKGF